MENLFPEEEGRASAASHAAVAPPTEAERGEVTPPVFTGPDTDAMLEDYETFDKDTNVVIED